MQSLIPPPGTPPSPGRELAATRVLLSHLGDPQQHLKVVHIAGSKGKGSTALFVESLLQTGGYRTCTFTSPHLQRWTERLRLDGRELEPARLDGLLQRLRPLVESLRRNPQQPSPGFFAVLTVALLLLARDEGVDYVVLEAGLGGRLDATNAADPAVCCITSVELEHTDRLGKTLTTIATEKAGIMAPGVPVVIGRLHGQARRVILRLAEKLGAPLWRMDHDIHVEAVDDGQGELTLRLDLVGETLEAKLATAGLHQAHNAALAVACVRRLDPPLTPADLQRGLAQARLPGRTEILQKQPWIVVDGAHTRSSGRALRRVLDRLPAQRRHLLLSLTTGKSDVVLQPLLPIVHQVTVTQADPHRSMKAEQVAAMVRRLAPGLPVTVIDDPRQALRRCRQDLPEDGLLCITGSVYLAGLGRERD